LTIHGRSVTEDRSYTIACGEEDEQLHVLYRLIPNGALTPQLVRLQVGDTVPLSGPYGQFVLRDPMAPLVFIATGTGIAPCRAYARTYPGLNMTVYHGVRTCEDLFYRTELSAFAYHPCVTQGGDHVFKGRVTELIPTRPAPTDAHYYLCGAYEMIYDMRAHLLERGVPAAHIFMEGYYYRPDY
jgi:ferredoxin-NADP reductase